MYNLHEEVQEGKEKMAMLQDLLDVQRRSNQQLCANFNKARREMVEVFKVACQERKKRQTMRRELDELKEEFVKLKGMVHSAVATVNIQNNSFPTEHIVDVFNPQIIEEMSSVKEVPQENLVPVPVPGPLLEIPQMLWEILPSPSPSLRAFLSEPVVITSSIPPLGTSPQLLRLFMEDSSVGVGATVEEFEDVVEREAEVVAMVDALVALEEEPLTNDPDAIEELYEVWDLTLDTSPVEGDYKDRYDGGGFV